MLASCLRECVGEQPPGELIGAAQREVAFSEFKRQQLLAMGGGERHAWLNRDLLQSLRDLAQFGGAPPSVFCNAANQIIGKAILPPHAGISGGKGFEDCILGSKLTGREETLDR